MNLGVGKDTAAHAIEAGLDTGLTPRQASAVAVQTSKNTNMDIGTATDLSQRFSAPMQGMAIMTELHKLGGYKSEKEYKSAIVGAQEGLNADPGRSNFAKKFSGMAAKQGGDWSKMSESQKLEFIASSDSRLDPQGLMAQGMSEQQAVEKVTSELMKRGKRGPGAALSEEQAKPMARLMAHRGELGQYAQMPPEDLAEKQEGMVRGVDMMASEEKARQGKSNIEVSAQKGVHAGKARTWEETQIERSAALEKSGLGMLVNENGKPGFFGNVASAFMEGAGGPGVGGSNYQASQTSAAESGGNVESTRAFLESQKTTYQENTSAIKELTATIKEKSGASASDRTPGMVPSLNVGVE